MVGRDEVAGVKGEGANTVRSQNEEIGRGKEG